MNWNFWSRLLDPTGFVPRAKCGLWTPGLIWLHNVSDFLIWTTYLAIPIVLVLCALKRRDELPFRSFFLLFTLFILKCATAHLMDILYVLDSALSSRRNYQTCHGGGKLGNPAGAV